MGFSTPPILIVGMHRSGTSMVTKLLGDNGLYLGGNDDLLGVNPDYVNDNPKGYWEFKPAVGLSERILQKLGGSWKRPPNEIGSFVFSESGFYEELEEADRIFSPFEVVERPWGWKDPRNSLLINFWKKIFPDLKILICVRNPLEVAFSLSKRSVEHVDFLDTINLWETYNRVILETCVGLPYCITHYESFFYDANQELKRILEFIGLFPDEVDVQSVDSKFYRGMVPPDTKLSEILSEDALELHRTLCYQAGEVFEGLTADEEYRNRKTKLATSKLLATSAATIDEMYLQMEMSQKNATQLELARIREKDIHIQVRGELEKVKNEYEQLVLDQQKILEENFRLGYELDRIQNSRMWKLLSRLRPFYGKVYWGLAKIFKFGDKNLVQNDGPISSWILGRFASPKELAEQKRAVATFSQQPVFSFITPVYNPPLEIFRELVQSVLDQTYPYWELCLANGGTDPEVADFIKKLADQDLRIKARSLDENLGISGNSNKALSLATGEYIVICDHDDLLEPNLLYEAVNLINDKQSVDLIYFDEDKVDVEGRHFSPFLKPSTFSPDLLISMNYLTHSIIRKELVENVGGFDPVTDGAQDWDIFLKIAELTQNIFHIDKILYHWRSVESSAASGAHIKPYALKAQKKAIEAHLDRIGLSDGTYKISDHVRHVRWKHQTAKVSIIIPILDEMISAQRLEEIRQKIDYPNFDMHVIGNFSGEGTKSRELGEDVVCHPVQITRSAEAYNYGAVHCESKYIFTGDSNLLPETHQALAEMVMWIQKPEIGLVGSKIINPHTRRIQSFGKVFGLGGLFGDLFEGLEVDSHTFFGSTMNYYNMLFVAPVGLLTEREKFNSFGGYSESLHEEFSAVPMCLNMFEAGERVVMNPFSKFSSTKLKREISYQEVVEAFAALKDNKNLYRNFYNNNLSYLHAYPTLSGRHSRTVDFGMDAILRRYYQNGSGYPG